MVTSMGYQTDDSSDSNDYLTINVNDEAWAVNSFDLSCLQSIVSVVVQQCSCNV
jgi:hypothetical protein